MILYSYLKIFLFIKLKIQKKLIKFFIILKKIIKKKYENFFYYYKLSYKNGIKKLIVKSKNKIFIYDNNN